MKETPRERVGAVIAAAGSSRRMEGIDKIFASLVGKPVLWHVLRVFEDCPVVDEVIVVLSDESVPRGERLVEEGAFSKVTAVCAGGRRRQDSVGVGLRKLKQPDWVVIHDGARPCLTAELIKKGLKEARRTGAAIAAVPLKETVKVVDGEGRIEVTPVRESLWSAQTPQVFRFDVIAGAYASVTREVTDDASMVEAMGHKVRVYMGRYDNIKVTTREDLALAETILRMRHEGWHRL
ncbi:MAG: 2-C-methyl-D-erythritol 4-phosphate cytidylyltransferase [Dehalococcoidia bacterium]|nr:2-C-methyl-D-erythritol 4-phosphate cytidylyltransferase [Dehalococcoidia bacterium]